jgi:hypothetical protein
VAYLIWLVADVACLVLAIYLAAPRWTRLYMLVWLGVAMLFLPVVLGLAQGQTSAVLLLACSALVRALTSKQKASSARERWPRTSGLGLSLVGWLLKPQLSPFVVLVVAISRRWLSLLLAGILLVALTLVALARLGPHGTELYLLASRQKLQETLTADPIFLIGPTLLHASHWFFGVNTAANVLATLLVATAIGLALSVWRRGLRADERVLLQLAIVPVVSVIAAPYALIYELMPWLVSFWLLWDYTETRPAARSGLLWLVAGVWISANLAVGEPRAGGADVAAFLGLCLVGYVAWLFHRSVDPRHAAEPQSQRTFQLHKSSPRGSE